MRRFVIALPLAVACTSTQPNEAVSLVQDEPPPSPVVTDSMPDAAAAAPLSDEAWVWYESPSSTRSCLGGCSRLPPSSRLDTAPASGQPFVIEPAGLHGWPEVVRFGESEAVAWRGELQGEHGGELSRAPRVLQCGDVVYAIIESVHWPRYRAHTLDPETGTRHGTTIHRKGERAVGEHQVQIACDGDEGLRVFGRIRQNEGWQMLYVDELATDGTLRVTRALPASLASATPTNHRHATPSPTTLEYRFVGGEGTPWPIGLSRGNTVVNTPKPLHLEAFAGDELRWTVDLGPAMKLDAGVVELDGRTIVRLGSRLVGLDAAAGRELWRTDTWGFRGELVRRPGSLGIWGCSRCIPTELLLQVEHGRLVMSATGDEQYVNVIEPERGTVLVRRIWR